jgi:hypothetical protein
MDSTSPVGTRPTANFGPRSLAVLSVVIAIGCIGSSSKPLIAVPLAICSIAATVASLRRRPTPEEACLDKVGTQLQLWRERYDALAHERDDLHRRKQELEGHVNGRKLVTTLDETLRGIENQMAACKLLLEKAILSALREHCISIENMS